MRRWVHRLGGLLCAAAVGCGSAERSATDAEGKASFQGRAEAFSVARVDKVDLLFVIDNSASMERSQAALRAQLPRFLDALTNGRRSPDDTHSFTPVRDLHIGVVSTDMGIAGVDLPPSCDARGGDDGRLGVTLRQVGLGCAASYPPFLTYQAGSSSMTHLAQDLSCMAALGVEGCGLEQQLEAPLKALTPRVLLDAAGEPIDDFPTRFVATDEARTWGRGDLPSEQGGNLGFLRTDPDNPSLLAIVLLTDEEDCSVKDTGHLKPNFQLDEGSPYRDEDINLRCFYHSEFSYDVRERYLKGFRALRPGREDLVVFSAIVGVPPDLVSSDVVGSTDFTDESSREAFYDKIMNDPRMIQRVDPTSMPGTGQGNIKPSCVRPAVGSGDSEVPASIAFPPRRIVELARAFGPKGMVQSICQDDFGPAIDSIVDNLANSLTEMCMPQQLIRDDAGTVSCKLYWELPTADDVQAQNLPAETPTTCSDLKKLRDKTSTSTDRRCAVKQLSVQNGKVAVSGAGWYYDDFTPDLEAVCAEGLKRIVFTDGAQPPRGVAVELECDAGAQQTK